MVVLENKKRKKKKTRLESCPSCGQDLTSTNPTIYCPSCGLDLLGFMPSDREIVVVARVKGVKNPIEVLVSQKQALALGSGAEEHASLRRSVFHQVSAKIRRDYKAEIFVNDENCTLEVKDPEPIFKKDPPRRWQNQLELIPEEKSPPDPQLNLF